MYTRKISKCTRFGNLHLRFDGDRALGRVSFPRKFFPPGFCWFVSWLLTISVSTLWRGAPLESKLPAAVSTKPSRFGTHNLEISSRRWPGTRICQCFSQVYPVCLCWFVCWLLTNTVSLQWRGAPMESELPAAAGTIPSRFGTRNLEVASRPWGGTRASKFVPQVFRPDFFFFVSWLFTTTESTRWCGVPMESKLPAVAMTKPSRFGSCNLENASRRWPGTRICKFFWSIC